MKRLLYVIAGLIFIVWVILIIGFRTSETVHFLLVIALIIVIFNILSSKKLSKNKPS